MARWSISSCFTLDIGGKTFNWYVFNLADVAIVAGVVGLLYEFLPGGPRRKSALIPADTSPAGRERCAPRAAPRRKNLNGNSVMRDTEASVRIVQNPRGSLTLAAAARRRRARHRPCDDGRRRPAPQDDDEDDKTFEEKIIDGIMAGLGGTNMENRGIEYRERSPLVVPPKLDLPPPASAAAEATRANWPKDPDVQRAQGRRRAPARRTTRIADRSRAASLTPAELAAGKTAGPARTAQRRRSSPARPTAIRS